MDAVLHAYAERPKHRVRDATIVELDDWKSGSEPTESILQRLRSAIDAFAFGALAHRRFFGNVGYCCADNFALIVQRFSSTDLGHYAYSTRRRDGGTTNVWSSNEFAFQKPLHVHHPMGLGWDAMLLAMLLKTTQEHWLDAIIEFNRANTDSPDVPIHVEMVMMKSAFERLLEIDQNVNSFVRALAARVGALQADVSVAGPLTTRWTDARPTAKRPLDAWAKEFCARRGSAAHGGKRKAAHYVWSEHAHLAFAAVLFPLLLRKVAADAGEYALTDTEVERLRRVDQYVVVDPFLPAYLPPKTTAHPWNRIDDTCRGAALAAHLLDSWRSTPIE
jgi:hypothetical protein